MSPLRIYLTNESYPELRGVRRGWTRSATWWRAIDHAARHARFWIFAVTQASILAVLIAVNWMLVEWPVVQVAIALFAFAVFSYLQTTWGGDMMRSHLRAVSDIARYACPNCGQSLYGHLDEESTSVRCPECGVQIRRAIFEPTHRTPREFRAFFRSRD